MKIGVITKEEGENYPDGLRDVLLWLVSKGCEVLVELGVAQSLSVQGIQHGAREEIPSKVDVVLVFGGDGTLLSVARSVQGGTAQILGVNLGSLGFLTDWTLKDLYPALESVLAREHSIDTRSMLRIEVRTGNGETRTYHALNDGVINKGALARIISMDIFVNEDFIANLLADGMIISTPTGSTAYSLSAGGPILYPTLDCLLLTPICPHTLTNRPLVVPGDSNIRVVVKAGEDLMLTVDGQVGIPVCEGGEILCTRSPYRTELIQPRDRSFFDILRGKLKWGER